MLGRDDAGLLLPKQSQLYARSHARSNLPVLGPHDVAWRVAADTTGHSSSSSTEPWLSSCITSEDNESQSAVPISTEPEIRKKFQSAFATYDPRSAQY